MIRRPPRSTLFPYTRSSDLSEGLAALSIDGKNGYVDTTGTVVIAPQFETAEAFAGGVARVKFDDGAWGDRKSTRLNSSHSQISYAVFCLKKKNKNRSYATCA